MVKIIIDIVNVVSTSMLHGNLDLTMLAKTFPEIRYDPRKFPGAVLRLPNPQSTILLFSTGKIISTGTKSPVQTRKVVMEVLKMLRDTGASTKKTKTRIENMVASINYSKPINLSKCSKCLPRSMYEPEQFPAVFHRMESPPATILIYKTGKLVCTGLNNQKKIMAAAAKMNSIFTSLELYT